MPNEPGKAFRGFITVIPGIGPEREISVELYDPAISAPVIKAKRSSVNRNELSLITAELAKLAREAGGATLQLTLRRGAETKGCVIELHKSQAEVN